jgi:Tol biopolymer transport system component
MDGTYSATRSLLRFVVLAVALGAGLRSSATAQEEVFGKNKVQYVHFSWSYLQTDHFDIYFSEGGLSLAQFAASAAETAYASISKSFRYQIVNRVPIIIYNSHNEFQQTNVVSEYLEEGIGGVTELFKNRVVLPYEGDYRKFRHVIHHELVHAVLNDMFYGGSIQSIITNNITLQLPLWFNEGLAEYEALRWDTDSDMFLRDATVHEYLPAINMLYGYFAYRGGQSVWWYIANKYGDQKIGEILNRIKSVRNVEAGFRGSIGLSLEELSERWQKEQKVLYWPDIAKREEPADYARRLTNHRKDGAFYNTSPAVSPQGDKIAFISDRNDYFEVFILNTVDGTVIKKLVSGQTTNNFEELHLLTPGISWSPDGKRVAIATKAGPEDAILIIDAESGEEQKVAPGLEGVFSVTWAPQGNRLAFVGNTTSQSDIYVYDLDTKQLTNLTNDIYSDGFPAWSPDGLMVYFSSDRREGPQGLRPTQFMQTMRQADIYRVNVATLAVERITDWPNSDETSVVVGPTGSKILFVSDRNGINNIYEKDLTTGVTRPITNSLSGVYQLSLSRDGSKLAFASLNYGGFDLFLMRNPFDRDIKTAELEPSEYFRDRFAPAKPGAEEQAAVKPAVEDSTRVRGRDVQIDFSSYVFKDTYEETVPRDSMISRLPKIADNLDSTGEYRVNRYKLNFSADIIYGNAGYDTFYGVTGSTIMAFSDLMGDHQIVFATNLLLDLKNSDFALQYYYLPNRIDYAIGGFHSARFVLLYGPANDRNVYLYRFRTYGMNLAALYPVDRFNRYEFALNWYNISKENIDNTLEPMQNRFVVVPGITYTHDTSLWGFMWPVSGSRYKVSLFGTPKVGFSGLSFVNVTGDYRTYFRLGRYYSLALRLAGGGSFGQNPQKFVIGGVDNWINRTFENGYVPLENAEDYIFLQVGAPLRGYNYDARFGSKYGLFNFEFRYPLLAFLQAGPLPIGLQSLGGVMFFDMGTAWDREKDFVGITRDPQGAAVTRDLLMGMGTGARVFFLAFFVKLDVAWAWYLSHFSQPKFYISLGSDF